MDDPLRLGSDPREEELAVWREAPRHRTATVSFDNDGSAGWQVGAISDGGWPEADLKPASDLVTKRDFQSDGDFGFLMRRLIQRLP